MKRCGRRSVDRSHALEESKQANKNKGVRPVFLARADFDTTTVILRSVTSLKHANLSIRKLPVKSEINLLYGRVTGRRPRTTNRPYTGRVPVCFALRFSKNIGRHTRTRRQPYLVYITECIETKNTPHTHSTLIHGSRTHADTAARLRSAPTKAQQKQ